MERLAQREPNQLRWYQFSLREYFILLIVVAVPLGLYCRWARRNHEICDLEDRILTTLDSLEAKCPASMTERQWESAITWTRTLVCNSIYDEPDVDVRDLRRFQTELQYKAKGSVDLDTIHWTWDQVARLCQAGKEYQHFRPHMLEEIEALGLEGDSSQGGLESRREQRIPGTSGPRRDSRGKRGSCAAGPDKAWITVVDRSLAST